MKPVLSLITATSALLLILPITAGAQGLSLRIDDGLVTLTAQNVPLREILERWSELADVTIVNSEALPATPVTMQLERVQDRAALAMLLRDVSGYILLRRQQPAGEGSAIGALVIARASTVSNNVSGPATPWQQPPSIGFPRAVTVPPTAVTPGDQIPVFAPGPHSDQFNVDSAAGAASGANGTASEPTRGQPGATSVPLALTSPPVPGAPPIRYSDLVDDEGNPLRAPTPIPEPSAASAPTSSQQPVAANPFGITKASSQPGPAAPAPPQVVP